MILVNKNSIPSTTEYKSITVIELLKFIEENKIPMDSEIIIERVEDVYFLNNNWRLYERDNPEFENMKQYFQLVENGVGTIKADSKKFLVLWMHY